MFIFMNVINLEHIGLEAIDLSVIEMNCITIKEGNSGETKVHTYYLLDEISNIITDESNNRIIYLT